MRKGDWEILDALYRSKNMTNAAKALFMSQPALTKRLQLIEDGFQCQIAVRTNRGISFTPQGEYLCKFAQQYMETVEGVRQTVMRMNAGQSNSLKIAAPVPLHAMFYQGCYGNFMYFILKLKFAYKLKSAETSPNFSPDTLFMRAFLMAFLTRTHLREFFP